MCGCFEGYLAIKPDSDGYLKLKSVADEGIASHGIKRPSATIGKAFKERLHVSEDEQFLCLIA